MNNNEPNNDGVWLFAYGSNMHGPEVQRALAEHGVDGSELLESQRGGIVNLALKWNYFSHGRQSGAANVVRAPGRLLEGVALRMTERAFAALDIKEGYRRSDPSRSAYTRRLRTVQLSDGRKVKAWVYKAMPNRTSRRQQLPRRDYVELMIQGANAHHLSDGYVAGLAEVQTLD